MSHGSPKAPVFLVVVFVAILASTPMYAGDGTFFVINSPSTASQGADSILTFDLRGHSRVFFGADNDLKGLRDITCDPKKPEHIFVAHNALQTKSAEFLVFNGPRQVDAVPSGTAGQSASITFDRGGNFYVAEVVNGTATIFKNDAFLASLPLTGIGQLAADSTGILYLTDPFVASRLFRIDQQGNVTVFADASKGLNNPFGLAVDSGNNVFVANNPPSSPAFVLKFDPSGTVTSFATAISFQPTIRSMTFDAHDNLYATLLVDNTILIFDKHGNSSVFANASDGLNFPAAIEFGSCPAKVTKKSGTLRQKANGHS